MEIEKNKFNAKISFLISIISLLVCTPFLFTSVLKFLYYQPRTDNFITNFMVDMFGNIAAKIYYSFSPIQFLWPISPKPSFVNFISWGNFFTIVLMAGFLYGLFAFQMGTEALKDMNEAKRSVRQKRLENEYRNRDV